MDILFDYRINVAAPLEVCTNEKQRAVIGFLWPESMSGVEINLRFVAQYDDLGLISHGYSLQEAFRFIFAVAE